MFYESRYDARQLRRNRIIVVAVVAVGIAACLLGGALTSWPWTNAIASSCVVAVFGVALWWTFASRKAGPVRIDPGKWDSLQQTFFPRNK